MKEKEERGAGLWLCFRLLLLLRSFASSVPEQREH